MRFLLVLAIVVPVLLAFGVACAGDEDKARVMPSPASESDGEAEEWEEADEAGEEETEDGGADEGDGEEAEADEDGDGVPDIDDNCPGDPNPDQDDYDGDLEGDACDVNDDNDGYADGYETDHGSDPLNEASTVEYAGHGDRCVDGVDNDLDGLTDGADPDCPEPPPLRVDSDDDGFVDSDEEDLGSDPFDDASVPEGRAAPPGSCTDGVDNDLDGLTDDADPACRVMYTD